MRTRYISKYQSESSLPTSAIKHFCLVKMNYTIGNRQLKCDISIFLHMEVEEGQGDGV